MAYANMDSTMSRPSSGIASPPRQSHIRSRTQSISSDRPSTVGHGLMSPPLTVSPEAAFIASSAASQIVTNDHDSHADTWYDQHGIEPSGETVLVSPAALQLVNNFLDQLLFNFLQLSRSTALSSLRPAVSEVLKPKLAKDAINNADEELREYLGGNDDDGLVSSSAVSEDWDVELVWKRARLRCMVYSSLGDMEEEDEDYYMEQEHLGGAEDWLDEVVSPAVAIFLTSILEYMGEQALIVAGQAAYHRMRARYEKELKDGSRSPGDVADRIVVEELDMERVALDRTLGRLWRAWKKRIRSPGVDQAVAGRAFSKDSSSRPTAGGRTRVTAENLKRHNMARDSTGLDEQLETPMETPAEVEQPAPGAEGVAEEVEEEEPAEEYLRAARIPLPMTDRDVDEIEVPGLVYYSEDEEEEEDDLLLSPRPKSLIIWGSISMLEATSPVWQMRQRSSSVPAPARRPYRSPPSEAEFSDGATPTQEEVTTPTSAGDYVEVPATKPKYRAAKGPIANIITSATSRGFSNASTPRSDGEFDEDDDDEIPEDFEILTTSRVSIGGQSPTVSESGMAQGGPLPVRSNSVRSARLIEVGPKSPVLKTRHESPEPGAATSRRTASGTSASKKSIAEEQPISHKDVTSAPRQTRKKTAESIPEMPKKQEYVGQPVTVLSPVTSEPGSVSSPRRFEDLQNQIQSVQPIFGSVGRHKEGPSSGNLGPPGTRVTIISTSTSPGPFVEETPPQVPEKSPVHARHQQQRVPTPPERVTSGSRQVNGAPGSPTTIGIPSVEGAAARGERMSGGSGRSNNDYAVRPIHTSGSAGSSSSTNKFKPIRTSEDGKNGVARTFEELIQSDQTMKYTLTPESMRDIESSSVNNGSPVLTQKSRRSEDNRQSIADRNRSSSDIRNSDLKRTSSVTRATGLNSHPVDIKPAVPVAVAITTKTSVAASASTAPSSSQPPKLNGPIPRAPPNMPSRVRQSASLARDARVPRESVLDFADFIRTTGPPGDSSMPTSRVGASVRVSGGGMSKPMPEARRVTSASKMRLQAREAVAKTTEDNSDLIDFIRQGPPSAREKPRIPRSVAPFRNTMDSDQMSGAVGGRAVDANLPNIRTSLASTNVTDMSMPSVHSSINSRSELIKKTTTSSSVNKPLPNANDFDDSADMMPKRKTRRARDPYAIDFSDDDEEDDVADRGAGGGRQPAQREESLIDFLRSVPPPESNSPSVPFDIPQTRQPIKKKASAPSLMSRFGRGSGLSPTNANFSSANGAGSSAARSGAASNVNGGSRPGTGRGYIPIQVNMPPGLDIYGTNGLLNQPTANVSSSAYRTGGGSSTTTTTTTGRVAMKKFEPREPVSKGTRTSELADFLRTSAPPPSVEPSMPSPSSDDGRVRGMFGARKKAAYA